MGVKRGVKSEKGSEMEVMTAVQLGVRSALSGVRS